MRSALVLSSCCAVMLAGRALGAPVTFSVSSGDLAASAKFDAAGTELVVTLTNTSASDVMTPTDVLTSVFFDLTGNPALARTSVVLAPGSKVYYNNVDVSPGSGIISGEYSYLGGGGALAYGATQGLGAVGFGLFGPANVFPGGNVAGQSNPPGGLDFGLCSDGDDPATYNGGTNRALVKHSVIFTLGGLPAGFDPLLDVSNVTFQYGTSLDETHIPEPASAGLLGLAGLTLAARRRRRRSGSMRA